MIPVTKTFFPPLEEYNEQLKRIWEKEWLTNRGDLVKELEGKLKSILNVPHITLTTNGTLPIQIALKVLAKGGEVITTPFSYVATTAAIQWENCTPVFVDIHPEFLTIDEDKIRDAITKNTTAILATHVFGNPCNIEALEKIARDHKLKVIYDAAHCFGVTYKGKSIFKFGDVSTCSFHATKLFHTAEGGAMFCEDQDLYHQLFYSHNFGHNGPEDFFGLGINAKMSELQAAMGLTVLPYLEEIKGRRESIVEFYDENIDFNSFRRLSIRKETSWNYSYYPIICKNETVLLEILDKFRKAGIYPRRYFYPSLENLPYTGSSSCPIAARISSSIICLPLYPGLEVQDLKRITDLLNEHK